MKILLKHFLLILLVLIGPEILVSASECYHYHVKKSSEVKNKNGRACWIQLVKDPNNISIADYIETALNGVSVENLQLISENADYIIIADKDYYYLKFKYSLFIDDETAKKLIPTNKVKATFGNHTFLVNNKWTSITYDPHTKKTMSKIISNFPENPVLIKNYTTGRADSYLIKDEKNVYVYNETEGTIKSIPNLTASQIRFFETNDIHDKHFLYDDDTFYLTDINFDELEDVTPQFALLGLKKKFTEGKIRKNDIYEFIDFDDNNIWSFIKAGLSLKGGENVYFYANKEAKFLSQNDLFYYKNNYFNNSYDLTYENNPIDVSNIKNINNLKKIHTDFYIEGETFYYLKHDDNGKVLTPIKTKINLTDSVNPKEYISNALWSYRYGLSPIWVNNKHYFYWNRDSDEFNNITPYQQIKDLKLAYLIDNKLLIENQWIESKMDFNTAEFLGSTVDVISPCDGGRGQIPIVIEYDYYFKDKNAVYRYHSQKKELEILSDKNPKLLNEANFIDNFYEKKNKPTL